MQIHMSNAAVTSVPSAKTGRRFGRRRQLLVGFGLLVAVSGSYLGWRHFANNPSVAMPEPDPPVPVIAATVQQRDFPIVLTGIGNVTALNTATVRSMVTEQVVSHPAIRRRLNRGRLSCVNAYSTSLTAAELISTPCSTGCLRAYLSRLGRGQRTDITSSGRSPTPAIDGSGAAASAC